MSDADRDPLVCGECGHSHGENWPKAERFESVGMWACGVTPDDDARLTKPRCGCAVTYSQAVALAAMRATEYVACGLGLLTDVLVLNGTITGSLLNDVELTVVDSRFRRVFMADRND